MIGDRVSGGTSYLMDKYLIYWSGGFRSICRVTQRSMRKKPVNDRVLL